MRRYILSHLAPLFLIFIICLVAYTNYVPGTYLAGWDNYQTDLNPWLGVTRAFFSVWQEGQSFGLLAGMGHGADLVRALVIWLMSAVIPQSMLRYAFHIFMLIAGTLGMYTLLKSLEFNNKNKILAFAGSLFYLFNFGSIQILFIPFESFSVMYGLLPWALWTFIRMVNTKQIKRNDVLMFIAINILLTPQGLSQQLFVTYLMLLGALYLGIQIQQRNVHIFRNAIIALLLIIIVNSFWFLPQLYFLKTSGSIVQEAKANQLHTSNILNQNITKGDISDFILMRGFHYDLFDSGKHDGLFQVWKDHFNTPFVAVIAYILAAVPLCGLFSKRKNHLAFILAYLVMAVALLLDTFPFSLINQLLRSNSLFNQIFRSPFTKFIIPYSVVASYLFTVGVENIISLIKLRIKYIQSIVCTVLCLAILIFAAPALQGYYFSPMLKVAIPQDYLDVIEYFKHVDKNKRIALLPDYTFWGWFQNNWGYTGSGFLWYGIEQPIISRTFDVWSLESESYFWQIKKAVESERVEDVENVLEKYNVSYLIMDYSLKGYGSDQKALQVDRTEELLNSSSKIHLITKKRELALYAFIPTDTLSKNFISVSSDIPNIGPAIKITDYDMAYSTYGTYKTNPQKTYQAYYPFLGISSQTRTKEPLWNITENENSIKLHTQLTKGAPLNTYSDILLGPDSLLVDATNGGVLQYKTPVAIEVKNNELTASFPKQQIEQVDIQNGSVSNFNNLGNVSLEKEDQSVIMSGYNGSQPNISYETSSLPQEYSYLLKIDNKIISGDRPYLNVSDLNKQQRIIEDKMQNDTEYYILPPHYEYGIGYMYTLYNYSYPGIPKRNKINDVSVYLFPWKLLKDLKFTDNSQINKAQMEPPVSVEKRSYYRYDLSDLQPAYNNIILWQSFHEGWKAYEINNDNWVQANFPSLFGTEIKNHVHINNWANGWILDNQKTIMPNSKIIIIFWPQYLEYVGFILLILTGTFIILKKEK